MYMCLYGTPSPSGLPQLPLDLDPVCSADVSVASSDNSY